MILQIAYLSTSTSKIIIPAVAAGILMVTELSNEYPQLYSALGLHPLYIEAYRTTSH